MTLACHPTPRCDHIINYKTRDVGEALSKIAPDGVDVAFEGVGGKMLQTVLEHLKEDGRLLQVLYPTVPIPAMGACCRYYTPLSQYLLWPAAAGRLHLRVPASYILTLLWLYLLWLLQVGNIYISEYPHLPLPQPQPPPQPQPQPQPQPRPRPQPRPQP